MFNYGYITHISRLINFKEDLFARIARQQPHDILHVYIILAVWIFWTGLVDYKMLAKRRRQRPHVWGMSRMKKPVNERKRAEWYQIDGGLSLVYYDVYGRDLGG